MDDTRKAVGGKERVEAGAVFEIKLGELKPRVGPELSEAGFLEPDVVVGVQIVEPEHGIAALQQPLAEMEADKPGGTCDEYYIL